MQSILKIALFLIAVTTLSTSAIDVLAHDGHGMTGSHWHAIDALGFIAVACIVGLIHWFAKRHK